MDTRTRAKPERTFDLVLKVECPVSENEDPVLLWKFPEDFSDQDLLCMVPKFCFPFAIERVSQTQIGQHFTFVLTDIDGKQRFGFCRLTSGGKICLCILSYLPWFEVYYKLLNTLADYLVKEQENDLNDMLKCWYNHPVPEAHSPVSLSLHSYFITPDVTGLPTIPESRNLTEYFVAVDINNMLQIYAAMLHERRIIFTSRKLSTLTACVHASASLLYPMYWQHIYIPVLPSHLLDYCCAPMPYLIGVHQSLIERLKSRLLDDVVMLNVDTNSLETPFSDISALPSEVVASLKSKLKKQSTSTGDGVPRAFLRAQASLFGSYKDALRYKPGEPVTFCEESFVSHRSHTMKQFLETAVNLQLFKQFIDGRLEKLNSGRGFTDLFEEEINSGYSSSYQQWVHTVKKGGTLINTAVVKASPAMKSAYKFAKNQAKQGIKEVKSKLKHKDIEEYSDYSLESAHSNTFPLNHSDRPNSQRRKLSQTRMNRPQTLMGSNCSGLEDSDIGDSSSKLSSEDSEEASGYFDDSDTSFDDVSLSSRPGGEMDLLGEILDSLSTHSSDTGAGRLTAAKSLDFFRSTEDMDYKVLNKPNPPSQHSMYLDSLDDWNLGQDDSVLHRRHLPPSLRKRSQKEHLSQDSNEHKSEFPAIIFTDPTAVECTNRPTSVFITSDTAIATRSRNSCRDLLSTQVPWEKEEIEVKGPRIINSPP
ncbi:hypothetical protein GDO86_007621 [Hymenochirus boettgeri]|uniref:UDENN domain-containing protein n=1 Tax=Hymenochirus boettgeri TaxID=247094 RepID=A0A8T2J1N4_9PIPI|nr:hypothetical protein GDO86_007621 [Hymenochirus boettgeri]